MWHYKSCISTANSGNLQLRQELTGVKMMQLKALVKIPSCRKIKVRRVCLSRVRVSVWHVTRVKREWRRVWNSSCLLPSYKIQFMKKQPHLLSGLAICHVTSCRALIGCRVGPVRGRSSRGGALVVVMGWRGRWGRDWGSGRAAGELVGLGAGQVAAAAACLTAAAGQVARRVRYRVEGTLGYMRYSKLV